MARDEPTSTGRTLAIVIPARDEAAAVGAQVRALRAHSAFRALPPARIIVVDNGSRDRTAEVAQAAGATVVREPRRGYGYACLAGVRAAVGANVVLLMDGDGSDDLAGAARVAGLVLAGRADLAMGARRQSKHQGGRQTHAALTPQQRAGNAVGALALRLIYGARVSDIAPVRAIRREALLALDPHEMAYGWSTEMLAKAARAGLRIVELPVDAHPRAGGKSKVAGTLRGTLGASAHILRTLWRYRTWQPDGGRPKGPAVEIAPSGLPATKLACAGWDQSGGRADWEQSGQLSDAAREAPSHANRRALFVVARLPVAGQTKTRLGQAIGHEAATALYRAFLRDLSVRLGAAAAVDGYDLFWYYAAPADAGEAAFAACVATEGEASPSTSSSVPSVPSVPSAANPSATPSPRSLRDTASSATPSPRRERGPGGEDPRRVRFIRQPEGDFATRLWHGFAELAARGYGRIVVLGSDSPQVPAAHIAAAFAALETHDIALGPARDGGYYLLGQRDNPTDLFTGIEMSTPRVAAETRARAVALGLSVATLPRSFDVDELADLATLARALADAPSPEADPAPATRDALAAIQAAAAEEEPPPIALPAATRTARAARPQRVGAQRVGGAAHGAA